MFEAVPHYAKYCADHADARMQVTPKGLSEIAGKAELFMDPDNLGWNTMVKAWGKASHTMKKVDVEFTTFDSWIADANIVGSDCVIQDMVSQCVADENVALVHQVTSKKIERQKKKL